MHQGEIIFRDRSSDETTPPNIDTYTAVLHCNAAVESKHELEGAATPARETSLCHQQLFDKVFTGTPP